MISTLIQNREFAMREAGATKWLHLAPMGDFPGIVADAEGNEKQIIQRIDSAAAEAIIKNFAAPALVDFEHRSNKRDGDTVAAAWIEQLELRDDGVWGRAALSDLGSDAIANKRYRYLSPTFAVEEIEPGVMRPTALINAAFTNAPNLKELTPLANRAAAESQNAAHSAENKNMAEEAERKVSMQKLKEALGLPDDAEEQAILDAVSALQKRVADVEAAKLDKEADDFVAANKALISDAVAIKKQYVENKDATISLFKALAVAAPPQTQNRAAAKPPVVSAAAPDRATEQKAFVMQVMNRDKCTFQKAWASARLEKPALFTE